MPSVRHEVLVMLLGNSPLLVCELARQVASRSGAGGLGTSPIPAVDPGDGAEAAEVSESKLTEIVPADYSADLVILVGGKRRPRYGLVVEVQLQIDEDKLYSWPLYVAALRARHRCPCGVLVVTPDSKVAKWAAEAIELGQPGSSFAPMVLGPDAVPRVASAEVAAAWPELGVLSALVHPDDFEVARAAQASLRAAFAVDETLARLYNDLILATLSPAVRAQLEAAMRPEEYEYQSEFARKHTAIGREQGREEGREEGREQGRAQEAVRAVLAVFAARGMAVPRDMRERVEACSDLDLLAVWLTRAVKAESAEQIFDQ